MGVVMERWCPTQQMLGVFLRRIEVKKLLLAGTTVLLMVTSADAQTYYFCGSSWTICRARALNRAYLQAHPEKVSRRVGCDALCQAKCDATSLNPAACYVKWNRLNLAGKARECEKTLGRGPNCS